MPKRIELSVGESLRRYCDLQDEAGDLSLKTKMRTALIRYTAPVWGFDYPDSQRMSREVAEAGLQFLDSVPLSKLKSALALQDVLFDEMGVSNFIRWTNRHLLKKFVAWALDEGMPKFKKKDDRNYRFGTAKKRWGKGWDDVLSRSKQREQLALKPEEISPTLQREFAAFKKFFCSRGATERSAENFVQIVSRFLGWLNKHKGVSLEELSLDLCLGPSPSPVKLSDFSHCGKDAYSEYCVAKVLHEEHLKEEAKTRMAVVDEYLEWLEASPHTAMSVLDGFSALVKFIFKDYLADGTKFAISDIFIYRLIRSRHSEWKKAKATHTPIFTHYEKSMSWCDYLEVVETLRYEANLDKVRMGSAGLQPRADTAIGRSLQRFLVASFFAVRPPDRSRTVYELELGKTLVRGCLKDGRFTPADHMSDPAEADWILHLLPKNYKTGKTYGEYWGIIPNHVFPDGTRYYEYLERWLTEFRPLFEPKHDYVFLSGAGRFKGNPLTAAVVKDLIECATFRIKGIRVTPKELRKMYVSYLRDCGVSEAELEAAAHEMHHSRAMQSAVYDQQDKLKKAAPILQFNQKVIETVKSPLAPS